MLHDLTQFIGRFGPYQFLIFILGLLPGFMNGSQLLMLSWTAFEPNVRCKIPSLDGQNESFELPFVTNNSKHWYLLPKTEGQYCEYCPQPNLTTCTEKVAIECDHGHVFDVNRSLVFNSLVIKYDMACETEWKHELLWSLSMVGVMLGAGIFSPLSDKYGRRPVFLFCALCSVLCVHIASVANSYVEYAIILVLIGALQTGANLTAFVLFLEIVDGLARTLLGIWFQCYFTCGALYLCLLAYLTKDWRKIQFYAALPSLLYIPYLWLFPESIRWMLANGKSAQAINAIKNVAKINQIDFAAENLDAEASIMQIETSVKPPQSSVFELLKHRTLAIPTLIVFYVWFACSMSYFGLAQNTQELPGNAFLTFSLSVLSDIPGYILSLAPLHYCGRRFTLVLFIGIGGCACTLAGFFQNSILVVAMALLGKLCIAAGFAVIAIYSTELFPTVVRQSGTGLSSVCARFGSILAPQVQLLDAAFGQWVPIVIYGVVALFGSFVCFFLPETLNRQLPTTIEDGIQFCRQSNRRPSVDVSDADSLLPLNEDENTIDDN